MDLSLVLMWFECLIDTVYRHCQYGPIQVSSKVMRINNLYDFHGESGQANQRLTEQRRDSLLERWHYTEMIISEKIDLRCGYRLFSSRL